VADAAFAVQIKTKRVRQLCVSHQQFTEAKRQNVGTLLNFHNGSPLAGIEIHPSLRRSHTPAIPDALWGEVPYRTKRRLGRDRREKMQARTRSVFPHDCAKCYLIDDPKILEITSSL
jgi:hypothetical protein